MSQELPMMPLWVKDWLSAVLHWPDAERGAYISLLCFQWVNGYVPNDVAQLARIMGTPDHRFNEIWLTVGKKFELNERGFANIRLEQHRQEALKLRDARTLGATLANQKRRAKRDARRSARNGAEHDAEHDAQTTHPSPSLSPISSFSDLSNERSLEEEKKIRDRERSANAQRDVPPLGKPHKRRSAKRDSALDDAFIEFKLAYPMRNGTQPWKLALDCWHARASEGYTPEQIIEGAKRYDKWVKATGKERTQLVMQAKTFLGPDKHFLADWEVLPEAANDERWSPESDEAQDPPDGYAA